jgi:hypothetical protein
MSSFPLSDFLVLGIGIAVLIVLAIAGTAMRIRSKSVFKDFLVIKDAFGCEDKLIYIARVHRTIRSYKKLSKILGGVEYLPYPSESELSFPLKLGDKILLTKGFSPPVVITPRRSAFLPSNPRPSL